jgi:tetratricopeptide (TPR) repeat protein
MELSRFNTSTLRNFLLQAFSDDELGALCFDYFRDVSDQFGSGMTKGQKVQLLLQYCTRRNLMPNLARALQRERPEPYATHFVPTSSTHLTHPTYPAHPTPPTPRDPQQIFISYAHTDFDLARRVGDALSKQGWRVWLAPHSIHPGEKWVDAVQRGLDESGTFLLLLTLDSVQSRWVKTETNVAIAMEHRSAMRVILLEAERCEIPTLWTVYQRVRLQEADDTLSENSFQAGLASLQRVLMGQQPAQIADQRKTQDAPRAVLRPASSVGLQVTQVASRTKDKSKWGLAERRQRAERWQTRAYAQAASGKLDQARSALQRALKYSPKPATVHADLARLHEQFKLTERAIAHWNQAIAIEPSAPYYARRAKLWMQMGKLEAAIADYTQAISLRPDMPDYPFARAQLYERKNDGRAIADFNRAIQLDRHQWTYYAARAQCHHARHSYERAINDFTRAIALNQTQATLYAARGHSYYCRNAYGRAVADYTHAIELDPKNGEHYYWRGMALKNSEEASWSQHDFQDALKLGCMLAAMEVTGAMGGGISGGVASAIQGSKSQSLSQASLAIADGIRNFNTPQIYHSSV